MAENSLFTQEIEIITDKLSEVFKMLDKLEKLEEKLNEVITKVMSALLSLILKLIPQKVRQFFSKSKSNALSWKTTNIQQSKNKLKSGYNWTKQKSDLFFNKIDQIQKYPVKEKSLEKMSQFKNFIISTPPKQHFLNLVSFLKPKFEKFVLWLKSTDKVSVLIKTSVGSLVIVGAVLIYNETNEIFNKEFPSRKIASVQEYDYRPDYKMYDQKTLKVLNIKVPIFVESIGEIDSITIDFSLRTTTRFAKYYLIEYEYKLKDYFFTTVEPVVSDFPIETEGKEVLKEKIREEIDNFLYENNVEGEVEEVNILYMVGS